MKLKLWAGAAGLALCWLVQPVAAGQLEDGLNASRNGDYETALGLLTPLAEQGNVAAQSWLGYMYYSGQGVKQDYIEAIKLFRKAAKQGDSFAQFNLGFVYENGQGVPQDYAEAAELYRKAAEQGDRFSQSNLGAMYADGRGVPEDFVQLYMWINLAAAGGDARYVKVREDLSKILTDDQIAEAQRLAREWVAAHPKP